MSSHPTRKLSSASTNCRPSGGRAALAPSDDAGSSRCGSRSCERVRSNAVLANTCVCWACVWRARGRAWAGRVARLSLERFHHVPQEDGDQHDGAARALELRRSGWLGLCQLQVIQRAEQERLEVAGRSVVAEQLRAKVLRGLLQVCHTAPALKRHFGCEQGLPERIAVRYRSLASQALQCREIRQRKIRPHYRRWRRAVRTRGAAVKSLALPLSLCAPRWSRLFTLHKFGTRGFLPPLEEHPSTPLA